MKYVWFIISAVQSIYEVGSGKFGGELTILHPGLQDPLLPLKNALMLKNMGGRGGGRGGGSGATRGKSGILRAQAGAGGRGGRGGFGDRGRGRGDRGGFGDRGRGGFRGGRGRGD